MNKFYVLIILIFLSLNSCLVKNALDQSPGTLGDCASVNLKCDRMTSVKILDSISKLDLFKVHEEFQQYNDWNEQGYDFLTHWTISGKNNLYWISLSDSTERNVNVSVRSVFDKKQKKWINSGDLSNEKIKQAENFMKWFSKKLKPCV